MTDLFEAGFLEAPIGLAITRYRIIQKCNFVFVEMFEGARETLEGNSLSELYPSMDEFYRIGEAGMQQIKESGQYSNERIMRRKSGELFWCRVRGRSLTPDDPFAHAVWSFADLSDNRPVVQLSKREQQVAIQLTAGKTSREIAHSLGISPRTVEAHRAKVLSKFNARNSAELIAKLTGIPA
ncbi:MAG: PAS and helix-turn-helix domain-containing protein [Paracoccaceae bacterium]|jgi:DNA-binding CsgD family transcriptional regulator